MSLTYTDVDVPFEERAPRLRNWGFECQCPRCVIARDRPKMADLEAEVFAAYAQAATLTSTKGLSMAEAADRAMPAARRKAARAALGSQPLAFQPPLLILMELDAAGMMPTSASEARVPGLAARALVAALEVRALLVAIHGERHHKSFTFSVRVAAMHFAAGDPAAAAAELARLHVVFCRPPWGGRLSASSGDFLAVVQRYWRPVDLQGPAFLRLVREAAEAA